MIVWINNCKSKSEKFIEIDFVQVLNEIRPYLSDDCYKDILEIIKIKKCSNQEKTEIDRVKSIDEWVKEVLNVKLHEVVEKREHIDDNDDEYNHLIKLVFNISIEDNVMIKMK